jgi:hypothetical protein
VRWIILNSLKKVTDLSLLILYFQNCDMPVGTLEIQKYGFCGVLQGFQILSNCLDFVLKSTIKLTYFKTVNLLHGANVSSLIPYRY